MCSGLILMKEFLFLQLSGGCICRIFFFVFQRWIWYSIGQTHTSSRTVWSFKQVSRGAIPPGGSMTWGENDEPLVLPSDLIPTGPPGCSIMMVSYELCVSSVQWRLTISNDKFQTTESCWWWWVVVRKLRLVILRAKVDTKI